MKSLLIGAAVAAALSGANHRGAAKVGVHPNRLVAIRDTVDNIDAGGASKERFLTLRTADFAEVLRGVAFTPGTALR